MVNLNDTDKGTTTLPSRTKKGKVKKTRWNLGSEVGLKAYITDKALKSGHKQVVLDGVRNQILQGFYRYCLINAKKPLAVSNRTERDASMRSTELISIIDAIDDKSLEAAMLKVNEESIRMANALESVNKVSIFSFLKNKIMRRKTVDFYYA